MCHCGSSNFGSWEFADWGFGHHHFGGFADWGFAQADWGCHTAIALPVLPVCEVPRPTCCTWTCW